MKKCKASDIVTITLFLLVIFGFGMAFWIIPDVQLSEKEGREMQAVPNFQYLDTDTGDEYAGIDYVFHGKLADEFDEYYCDQFPLRNFFLGLKAATEVAFGRDVNNGVYYSSGEFTTVRFETMNADGTKSEGSESFDETHVKNSLETLNDFCESLENVEHTAVMLPPRSVDVKAESIGYPTDVTERLDGLIKEGISEEYLIELLDIMQKKHVDREKPYFSTDHHWTVTGAYYAYAALMESWGETPYALSDFGVETFTDNFCGSSLRNGNFFFSDGEELQIVKYEGIDNLTVKTLKWKLEKGELAEDNTYDGLYDCNVPDNDAYSVFLHGKQTYMKITAEGEERETLLLYKDSFGHSLAPFLARHYDLVIVDIDQNIKSLSTFVEMFKPDRVLVIYNIENLITSGKLLGVK